MNLTPSLDTFTQGFDAGKNQVVYARLAADLDTPVSLMLKLAAARKDSFMLESVTGGETRGRYSIIGMKPDLIWQCHGDKASINRQAWWIWVGRVSASPCPMTGLATRRPW